MCVCSVNDFITAWRKKNDIRHQTIMQDMSRGRGFTWAAHFYAQSYWLANLPLSSTTTAWRNTPSISNNSVLVKIKDWLWGFNKLASPANDQEHFKSARANVIIVRHTHNRKRFAERVTAAFTHALREVGITKSKSDVEREENGTAIPNINISMKLKNDTNVAGLISHANMAWLRDRFKDDFKLVRSAKTQFIGKRSGPWKAVY